MAEDITIVDIVDLDTIGNISQNMYVPITDPPTGLTYKMPAYRIKEMLGINNGVDVKYMWAPSNTPPVGITKGQGVMVSENGPTNITGVVITAAVGDVFWFDGSAWQYIPYSAQARDTFTGTVTQVRNLSGANFKNIISTDQGGGTWIFDPADSVSEDNTGTVIVTADNKRYKRIHDGAIYPEWFGAVGNGVVDDAPAINAALDYAYSLNVNLGEPSDGFYALQPKIVFGPKMYKINSTLTFKIGVDIEFQRSLFIAGAAIDYVIWTQDKASDYLPGTYANKRIFITGTGYIDGAGLATYGFYANTFSNSNIEGLTVVGCTRSKWGVAEYQITGYDSELKQHIIGVLPTKVALRDVVMIYNATDDRFEDGAYNIQQLLEDNRISIEPVQCVTLDFGTKTYYLRNIPTGFAINGNQNFSYERLSAFYNTAGFAFGATRRNDSGYGNIVGHDDNLHDRLIANNNDFGALYMNANTAIINRCTYQHSKYVNLIIADCGSLVFTKLYCEVDENFASANSEKYSMIYVSGNNIKMNIHTPVNSGSLGWSRVIRSNCIDLDVELSGHNNLVNSVERPTGTGDFAIVKLVTANQTKTTRPSVRLRLGNYNNLQYQYGLKKAICDDAYTFPENQAIVEAFLWNTGNWVSAGARNIISNQNFLAAGELLPRLQINPSTGIWFGSGAAETTLDGRIQRFGEGEIGTPNHWRVVGVLNVRKPSGSGFYIWSTNSNQLKIGTAIPTNRDTEGSVVSTLQKISVTASVTFTDIAANSEQLAAATITLSGAATGDSVQIVPASNSPGLVFKALVTSANTITLVACNFTTALVPGFSKNFTLSVIK